MQKMSSNPFAKADLNWFKIKYLKHASPDKLRVYSYKGQQLYYLKPSELLHGLNEIFVDEVYKLHLNDRPIIIDCGANIGMSVIYLKERFPNAKVIAFEPDNANFELLNKNVSSFGLQDVSIRKEAVWIENTELSFESDGTMGSKISTAESNSLTRVKAVRLKDLIAYTVDFLKLDIEGAEYEVLKDIAPVLHYVSNMFLEYHGKFSDNSKLVEILQIIETAGFTFYIKEAATVYANPFDEILKQSNKTYDVQLNIFCLRQILQ
jgi:FkbM family methyltransferase